MRKSILILTTLLFFFCAGSKAQSVEQIKNDRKNYIWGEGSGVTLKSADQDALGMLINQISANVESNFTHLVEEVQNAGKTDRYQETFKGVINTYSNATLHNTERIVLSNEPDARVFRYIKRADVQKIFEDRKLKILDFVKHGIEASEEYRPADALRYFYWSLTLLRSHPEASTITYTAHDGSEFLLNSWLDNLIRGVFADINIEIADVKKNEDLLRYNLMINYRGKPARNYNYSYWTGRDWTNIHSAKDGRGIAEYQNTGELEEISLRTEYIFEGETSIDHELRDVMQKLEHIPYGGSYFNIPVKDFATKKSKPAGNHLTEQATKATAMLTEPEDTEPYLKLTEQLISSIETQQFHEVKDMFTQEGYDIFQQLIRYGKAKIAGKADIKLVSFENDVICRSIPMSFHFSNNQVFVEDVVLYFEEHKKIYSMAFALDAVAISDIYSNNAWDETIRINLISFLEQYKTAYALKRLDYLESIFDDNAYIVVGTVLKKKEQTDGKYQNNEHVRYSRFTKEEFIKNLSHSFASKEFINIRFEDNAIRKSGRGEEVYGINIKQRYFSSNYGDTGYLFLLVDMKDSLQPLIHVRTWQPGKAPVEDLIDLSDF